MSYRIVYSAISDLAAAVESQREAASEEYSTEHQALGRARELLETGEHHHVAVDDGDGNLLHGVRLQLKLGGFSGD